MPRNQRKAPGTWTRDPDKERFWRRTLAEYSVSGLSISEFCRQRDLSAASFGAWKRELQIRDREDVASGRTIKNAPVPELPASVKDSRGRIIPSRFRKWLDEPVMSPPSKDSNLSPFVPLKLVEDAKAVLPVVVPATSQIEIHCPSGITIRLDNQADIEFVSKLLRSMENH